MRETAAEYTSAELFIAGQVAGLLFRTTPAALRRASQQPGLKPEYADMVRAVADLAERLASLRGDD